MRRREGGEGTPPHMRRRRRDAALNDSDPARRVKSERKDAFVDLGGKRGVAAMAHLRHIHGGHSRRGSHHAAQEHQRGGLHVREQGRGRMAQRVRVRRDLFLRRRLCRVCGQVRLELRSLRGVDRRGQHAPRHPRRVAGARQPHQVYDLGTRRAHHARVFREEV